jgi:3-hydroxyacyl-CoA dehydrogenase/enoyl-CoA hydratase/3-hydroxybutyryl-CoA epimerase
VLDRLARLAVPTAAIVHGACLGGGLELALACRFRAALASSVPLQIGSPEVQLGLVPAWGAIVKLTRLLAPRDALNLLLTGNPLGFLQAKSQGLVDRLVSKEEQERIAETLQGQQRRERTLDRATWNDELVFAAAKADEQPADFPEAQQAIMQLVATDLAQGPEAAGAAAIERCAELGVRPVTQHAIAVFFQRRRSVLK